MKGEEITVMAHHPTTDMSHSKLNAGPPPLDVKSHGTPLPSRQKNKKQLMLTLKLQH
jgi:hypothetical protein